ncbi:flagellin [Salipaludibacillus sp. CUR1]|uniref:flagellin N-terminal helical domain-containing protein n=1 Tax=Salipaludibacillus sp. CUR1 TaxID=2820003 RepID=UPI001E494C81|nr:flagellin [Salipaludibacillus sp. CUR1]MCE7792728.1 flagellin [Salipaludibacillus sp. CUR1]
MIINNNIPALNTHRQMGINQNAMQNSMEKLSSGMRINRAGDDAAGLAISEKMRAQINGLDQASRNAQDGISLIQTAEGALDETHSILQRMRELAVQSANDTNVEVDREELQKEVDQLANELTRISDNTEFNTQNLLNGDFEGTFHIGANSGQNINLSIDDMSAQALGVNGAVEGLTATTADITIDGTDFTAQDVLEDENGNIQAVLLSGTADEDGDWHRISDLRLDTAGTALEAKPGTSTLGITVNGEDASLFDLDSGFAGIDISSQETADAAIKTINNAIETVSAERSKLGATQNRLEHTISNLDNSSENLSAAESRIRDVDMAAEMMEMTRANILAQASQSMLAQANQQPQSVLQLLG